VSTKTKATTVKEAEEQSNNKTKTREEQKASRSK